MSPSFRFFVWMKSDFRISSGNVLQLMLLVGIVQVSLYYLSGATIRSDGGFAVTQPDTLLYCQAARRIVEGHPLSFSEGVAPSTGTTSVLYPFVLAIPYLVGCTGDSLLLAGFFLNAAFYLVFLWAWGLVICEKFRDGIALFAATMLVALSGHAAFCALSQSDVGLWMAVSSIVAAGFALKRPGLFAPALLVAPWVRPEGAIVAVSFAVASVVFAVKQRDSGVRCWLIALGVAALLSTVGVFALNFVLTGYAGFSSVAHKGYFSLLPFADAIARSAIDAVQMAKGILLGIPSGAPRDLFSLPLLGAAFMWLGVFAYDWRKQGLLEASFLVAAGLGFLLVAASGWQGTNMDRYLAWMMPIIALFTARGLSFAAERFRPPVAVVPSVVLFVFSAASALQHAASFHVFSARVDQVRAFAEQCERTMTQGSAVGVMGWAGIAYEFSSRRVAHLPGIYSPEFEFSGNMSAVVEMLKREPEKRFYYMFSSPEGWDGVLSFRDCAGDGCIDKMVLAGPRGFSLKKMQWSAFDRAAENPASQNGRSLSVRVDVGYEPDEREFEYDVLTSYDQPPLSPFAVVAPLCGTNIVEAGRLLLGGDEMTIPLALGKDVEVVLRTAATATATAPGAYGAAAGGKCLFSNPMELHIEVDGREIGNAAFYVENKGFSDVHFTIPGSAIVRTPCRVAFHGDHVAYGYWFYQ